MKIIILNCLLLLSTLCYGTVDKVEKVHVIFKTHLDIGFTKLSSEVEKLYIEKYIPQAIKMAETMQSENGENRYIWTTGSWLIYKYLEKASETEAKRLEYAIKKGYIVWNALPYTVESEILSYDMFKELLQASIKLDKRFGKHTIAGKMTDVPGHTLGIISPLCEAGIKFLHIGVNSSAALPHVPEICRWRNVEGKELILMYQKSYGEDTILPDGKTAVSINLTGDNLGVHTKEQIESIYTRLRKKYPKAKIFASTLNAIALDLEQMKDNLPVVTSEIGDTWIYGYGSSPLRMSAFRTVSDLFSDWIHNKKIDINSNEAIDFALELGLIAEHTWGLDVKTHLQNWDVYDYDRFCAARNKPEFRLMEKSWEEIDRYIESAISYLPVSLQKEANNVLKNLYKMNYFKTPITYDNNISFDKYSIDSYGQLKVDDKLLTGEIAYQTFSSDDYSQFQNNYLRHKAQWAIYDTGKPGLENSTSKSCLNIARVCKKKICDTKETYNLMFPYVNDIDSRIYPKKVCLEYKLDSTGRILVNIKFVRKPANRMPEAYWLSFHIPDGYDSISLQKIGSLINPLNVVEGGNRQMHAIDKFIDIIGKDNNIRIYSLDAPLVAIGERDLLNYSINQPNLSKGFHFCLFNNLWGTNFSQWFGGDICYRFIIEKIKK